MQIYYSRNNKKLKTSVSNSDMKVFSTHHHARHVVKIKAKKDLTLLKADHKIAFFVNHKDKYFLNGYQSWTDTAEFYLSKRERNIKKSPHIITHMFAMDKYGDSSFYRYSIRKSHGYDIFYSKGTFESFLYSLNYETAYLIIELFKDQRCLKLISDVKGIEVKEGEEVTIFDYRFFNSYEEGIEEFNEDFPLLNKEKIFGYTSWYNYYQNINEEIILRDLDALDNRFNVFQIDDGYENYVGDWLEVDKTKFPNGLEPIVNRIKEKGFKPGIWLAPFAVETKSKIFKEHQDWLVKDSKGKPIKTGGNWSGFYSLDIYNPQAREYIKKCLKHYMDMGFEFFKLDFLYASSLIPCKGKSRCQNQLDAYKLLRDTLKDKLILGCGANIINSYKNFDYLRIGPDVSLVFDDVAFMRMFHRERISTKVTLQNTIYRHIFDQRLFGNDPDVFLLRDDNIKLSNKQRYALTKINALFGSVLMTSDDIATYDSKKKEILEEALRLFKNGKVINVNRLNKKKIAIEYELDGESRHMVYNTKKGVLHE